ncbi:uncharacterized protein LOC129236081 [Anastrepha obliqua]|uniref:uncharacterized protein LOC129236081 n=1 Tax=Anastrepha obliqua TaxID=95512 RepID=UPI0024099AF4|nr:uncharacterized protein LOC129236081 [Anastrepha obliqua]
MESGFHTGEQKLEQQQHTVSIEKETLTSFAIDHRTPLNSQQRLIPLTRQVVKLMMDFNGSHSSTSISGKNFYNTFSITSLVREEVQNILQELCVTDQFIRKEDIDAFIERCLREKVQIESKSPTASVESLPVDNTEIEVTVEMLNETDKNKLIVENFQILEQRITNLEERISTVLQTVPKLRHLQAKKFKINTEVIREELRNVMHKMAEDDPIKTSTTIELRTTTDTDVNETETTPILSVVETDTIPSEKITNPYDDLYYVHRQNAMNILNYKKSKATMELNQRLHLSPHIKPITTDLNDTRYKQKQKPIFITK